MSSSFRYEQVCAELRTRIGLAPEAVEFALQQFPDLRCIVVTPNWR